MTSVSAGFMPRILCRFLRCRLPFRRGNRTDEVPVHTARCDHRRGHAPEHEDRTHQERVILRAQQDVEETVESGEGRSESHPPPETLQPVAAEKTDARAAA